MARRIRDTALSVRPDLLQYFNGVGFEDQQDIGNYLEFECLPTGGWGLRIPSRLFPLPAYAGQAGAQYDGPLPPLVGRFRRVRTEPSLEYDCGLANGLRSTIGNH